MLVISKTITTMIGGHVGFCTGSAWRPHVARCSGGSAVETKWRRQPWQSSFSPSENSQRPNAMDPGNGHVLFISALIFGVNLLDVGYIMIYRCAAFGLNISTRNVRRLVSGRVSFLLIFFWAFSLSFLGRGIVSQSASSIKGLMSKKNSGWSSLDPSLGFKLKSKQLYNYIYIYTPHVKEATN